MTFTIDQIYKNNIPRGEFYKSDILLLDVSHTSPLEVSPSTNPNWMILVEKMRVWQGSLITAGTGSGILQLTYPDYVGIEEKSFLVPSLASLPQYADEVKEVNSQTYYDFLFKPPIIIKAGSTISSMSIGLPNNVTVSSGSMGCCIQGWKLKEIDYE